MCNDYIIYMHKNKINNKCYIGQTNKVKAEYRWGINGSGYKNQPKFYRAIKKYGWDNFDHIILETDLDERTANIREQYYINFYNSIKTGYNCQAGEVNRLPVTSKKPVHQYSLAGEFIKSYDSILTAATSLNLAAGSIVKVCKGQLKSCGNFIWSYKKQDHAVPISRGSNAKKILQYDLTGKLINIFNSIDQAALFLGQKSYKSSICSCCKHRLKSCYDYVWRYENDPFSYQLDNLYTRPVSQYDLNGNLIKVWNSGADIYRSLGISKGNIYACCRGKRLTAGGYIWKYFEESKDA